jgi:hypothetical protein
MADEAIAQVQNMLRTQLMDRYLERAERAMETRDPGVVHLARAEATELWNAFVLEGAVAPWARHGMLLGPEFWPAADLPLRVSVTPPLPSRFCAARLWLVMWMRERAAVVAGRHLEAALDALLHEDDEALIAIDLDSRDTLQSWGGHGHWFSVARP